MGICDSVYLYYKIKQQFKTKDYGNFSKNNRRKQDI